MTGPNWPSWRISTGFWVWTSWKKAAKREADEKIKASASASGGIVITGEGDPEVDALVLQRAQAKKAKDFAGADRIRDALKAMGVEVTDTKDGAAWRRV